MGNSNTCFNLINPLSWFVQEQQCTNHAKPSLRSGADLKVKPMLECPNNSRKKKPRQLIEIRANKNRRTKKRKQEAAQESAYMSMR